MEKNILQVETRNDLGKKFAKKIRRQGKIPGIIYGKGQKTVSVSVDPRIIEKTLLEEGGRNKVFTLQGQELEGKNILIKEWQVDPVKRNLLHVDLLEIDVNKKIAVTVPLNFTGKSLGVTEGGVLNIIERTVQIRCLPHSIPKHIDVDVTSLKIGHSVHLDEITLPEGIEKASQTNPTLVACVPPTKEEEAVASLQPTAEPEVITEKKPAEGAEAASGAAADTKKEAKKEEKK